MKTLLGEKARLVQRGYFAMVPRQRMEQFLQNALDDWTENDRVEEIDEYGSFNGFCTQRRILRVTVLFNQRQPTVEYRKRFLSLLIEKVEAMKWDVFEDVWLASSQCRQKQQPVENAGRTVSPSDQQTAEGYRTFFLDNDDTLQLTVRITHQPCIVSYGTTGLSTWDAGFYMVEWISRRPSVIRNKRVLELGAGSGLSGMCLLRLFSPSLYIFSDHHESVLSRLHDNLTLNELDQSPAVKVVELDWAATANEDVRELSVDVILAADVSYDPALFHPFFSTLNLLYTAASENALEIFIAMKRRSDDTYHHFHEVAKTHGWCLDDVTEPAATGRCFVSGSYMSDDCLMFKAQLVIAV